MEYEVSYRSGGGLTIAALAMASKLPISGEFASAELPEGGGRCVRVFGEEQPENGERWQGKYR
jgi:hypothetical protein